MTIRSEDDPLLKATIGALGESEVDPLTSTVLGGLFTRVMQLVKAGDRRIDILLPDFGQDEDVAERDEVPQKVEMLEWTITEKPITEVVTAEGVVWYIYPLIRSEVEFDEDGVHETDGAVALMLASAATAQEIDLDDAAEILQIYVYDETEDGSNVYWSTDFCDYTFSNDEVIARYMGLLDVVEADLAADD